MSERLTSKEVVVEGHGGAKILLALGDSFELMAAMAPGSVSVICCSPPYNLSVKYEAFNDSRSREDYLVWSKAWLGLAFKALSAQGHLFLNMGAKPSDPYGPDEVLQVAKECGWRLQNKIHWVKSVTVKVATKPELIAEAAAKTGLSASDTAELKRAFREIEGDGLERTFGHFKPLNTSRYLNDCYEPVFHLTKTGDVDIDRKAIGAPYEDKTNIARWGHTGGENKRCRGNVWAIAYETIQSRDAERASHPATFPVELAEMCLKLAGGSEKVALAMDPFAGTGTTAVACAKLGINCLAVELGPKAFFEAVRRCRAAVK